MGQPKAGLKAELRNARETKNLLYATKTHSKVPLLLCPSSRPFLLRAAIQRLVFPGARSRQIVQLNRVGLKVQEAKGRRPTQDRGISGHRRAAPSVPACLPQMRAEIAATGIRCTCGWRVPAHMQSCCAFSGTTTKVRLRFLSRSTTNRSLRALQLLRWLLADGSGAIELSEFKKMMAAFNINLTHHVSQSCCNLKHARAWKLTLRF